MSCPGNADFNDCTKKCKCFGGECQGTVYDCSDPCGFNEEFDSNQCTCVSTINCDYKYRCTILIRVDQFSYLNCWPPGPATAGGFAVTSIPQGGGYLFLRNLDVWLETRDYDDWTACTLNTQNCFENNKAADIKLYNTLDPNCPEPIGGTGLLYSGTSNFGVGSCGVQQPVYVGQFYTWEFTVLERKPANAGILEPWEPMTLPPPQHPRYTYIGYP